MILHAFILTTRPKKSAEAYSEVWTERGSPLLYHLEDQVAGVTERLQAQWGDNIVVKGAMRYGQPSIGSQVQALLGEGVQQLVVLPLYPQFGGPTTASTFDALSDELQGQRWLPDLRFVSSYHDHPPISKPLPIAFASIGSPMGEPINWCCPTMACQNATCWKATPTIVSV